MPNRRHLEPELPRSLSCICALISAFACTDPHRDLGQTADDMPNAMEGSECDEGAAPRDDKLQASQATFLSDFVGLWLGHAEDALGNLDARGALPIYSFPSSSTRIRLEVWQGEVVTAKLTFGADAAPSPDDSALGSSAEPSVPSEGFEYWADSIASALDAERSKEFDADGKQLALDGKLVLAFSIDDRFSSELHLRFGGEGLVGAFDGLSLINQRGFLTRPGSVRFRRATQPSE
jgi:hypothetical protein